MEKLPMCRICLVKNVRMDVVDNKNLHELYEKLTDVPFVTEDRRPILACFICCAQLKKCDRLLKKCLEAEQLFGQILNEEYEQKPLINQDHLEVAHGFIKTPIEIISIVEVGQTESIVVKEELQAVCEELDDNLVPKEEHPSDDDLEAVHQQNNYLEIEYMPPHQPESQSEDDLPLMDLKIEVEAEQGVHEKKRKTTKTKRPAVAEKPNLHLRRTKLEDSIPADQKTNQISKIIRATQNRTSKYKTKFKKLHECEICHYKFSKKAHLTDHIRTHSGEKPYKCDICQCSFSQKVNLTDHIRTHTGEKPYKCDICQSRFSRKHNLTSHIRIHTGVKPYKCDICQCSFRQMYTLTSHIRTHTGEKPFKCDICQNSFSQKTHLTDHIRTHTGEKPYKCETCQHSYSRKAYLIDHIRIGTHGCKT